MRVTATDTQKVANTSATAASTGSDLNGKAAQDAADSYSSALMMLAVILGAYTVYLDLWLCDLDGNVRANGRADRFNVVGQNVAHTKWFKAARGLRTGDDYAVGDVESQPLLGNAQVATYCASVRQRCPAVLPSSTTTACSGRRAPTAAARVSTTWMRPSRARSERAPRRAAAFIFFGVRCE